MDFIFSLGLAPKTQMALEHLLPRSRGPSVTGGTNVGSTAKSQRLPMTVWASSSGAWGDLHLFSSVILSTPARVQKLKRHSHTERSHLSTVARGPSLETDILKTEAPRPPNK